MPDHGILHSAGELLMDPSWHRMERVLTCTDLTEIHPIRARRYDGGEVIGKQRGALLLFCTWRGDGRVVHGQSSASFGGDSAPFACGSGGIRDPGWFGCS